MATAQETAMRKSMHMLNLVNNLGAIGWAKVLDTAPPEELAEITKALEVLIRSAEKPR